MEKIETENTLLTPTPAVISQPKSIFEKIAFYINLFLIGICLIIIIFLGGVKAWCSAAIIAVLSGTYAALPAAIKMFFPNDNLELSDIPVSICVIVVHYLIIIAFCAGFGKKQLTKTAVDASINGALFMIIVLLIILIPGSVNLFGNTVGYWIVSSFSNVKINEIIRPLLISINDRIKQNTDYSFLITLDADNINETIQKINENTTDNLSRIIGLQQYIQQKNNIGHLMWVSLASIATVITTLSGRTLSISAIITSLIRTVKFNG